MKLIITEKKAATKQIMNALADRKDIVVAEIGGHIYTDDESDYLQIFKDDLSAAKSITLTNGEIGYVLGEDTIIQNVDYIKKLLKENTFDVIINACDMDKNGDELFYYAGDLVGFGEIHVMRLELLDMTEDHIRKQYDALMDDSR